MASEPTPAPAPMPAATPAPTAAPAEPIIARYQGDGTEYITHVPARDLTATDWAALDDATRAAVRTTPGTAGPLYLVTEPAPQAPPSGGPGPPTAPAPAPTAAPAPAPPTGGAA